MTTYGYIGLGAMGAAMAQRLLSTGVELVVHDIDPAAVRSAVGRGAVAASTAAEIGETCDIVSICVPASHHVEAVLTGPGGLAASPRRGSTVLIHSTVHPDTMTWARETAAPWGVAVHDACVAGGIEAARVGELVILAGDVAKMAPAARALLGVYGSEVIDAGPVGAGAAMKVAFNVMTYAQQAAARVAFEVVAAAGADTDALVGAWRHVGQLGRLTEQYLGLLALAPDDIRGEFREAMVKVAAIGEKDLEVVSSLCGDGPLVEVVESLRRAMPAVMGVDGRSRP